MLNNCGISFCVFQIRRPKWFLNRKTYSYILDSKSECSLILPENSIFDPNLKTLNSYRLALAKFVFSIIACLVYIRETWKKSPAYAKAMWGLQMGKFYRTIIIYVVIIPIYASSARYIVKYGEMHWWQWWDHQCSSKVWVLLLFSWGKVAGTLSCKSINAIL